MEMDILKNTNIDVLVAIITFSFLLNFVLFAIIIKFATSMDNMKKELLDIILTKCESCRVVEEFKRLNEETNTEKKKEIITTIKDNFLERLDHLNKKKEQQKE